MSLEVTIESSSLTKYQKQIVKVVYTELKNNILEVIEEIKQMDPNNISIEEISKKILIIISQCIKIIEKTKVNKKPLEGADKKQIVLELGKITISTEIEDNNITSVILPIYDTVAEDILETIIDVSSHVNIEVKKGCAVLFTKIKHKLSQCLN
jgi:hypothetical protein